MVRASETSGASDDVAIISSTTPAASEVQSVSSIPLESQLFSFPKPMEEEKPSTTAELTPVPVRPNAKGEGLPYAPEGFPCAEDKWIWKVGQRNNSWGIWNRFLAPPPRLRVKGKNPWLGSKVAVEKYMRRRFPEEDLEKFFASFIWAIPCASDTREEDDNAREMISAHAKRPRESDVDGRKQIKTACKAGNVKCCLQSVRGKFSKAMECDICCTELGFCRECSCILCGKPIDHDLEYHYIQCQGKMSEDFICGHVAHMECAVNCKRGGVVRQHNLMLDVEYFCMRCDNKTDLLKHVLGLITVPGSGKSKSDVETSLKLANKLVDGTEQMRCRSLENLIKKALKKLESGMEVHDIFGDVQDSSVTVNAAGEGENLHQMNSPVSTTTEVNCEAELVSRTPLASSKRCSGPLQQRTVSGSVSFLENDQQKESLSDAFPNLSDLRNLPAKFRALEYEKRVYQTLHSLQQSQAKEYKIAQEKLFNQKDLVLTVLHQLDETESKFTRCPSLEKTAQKEEEKFVRMLGIAGGFGNNSKEFLYNVFGLR